ncbi:MAG TPA: LysR substrate-binding domain-containing protein [Eoetvoesiella sp.]
MAIRRPLPSIKALIAFECAARHGNFTRAADELALSEGAVSRQIAILESLLGQQLFARVKRRVVLTLAGEVYARKVKGMLALIERETLSLMAHGGSERVLELAVLPTFASEWLIPRLESFMLRQPRVSVSMSVRTQMFMFETTNFDCAIHFGQPTWPGACVDPLFGESLVPVCRPGLVPPGVSPAALLAFPLLHSSTRPNDWASWFSHTATDAAPARVMSGARFELHSMVIDAAKAGLGVALLPQFLVQRELDHGGLVVAVERQVLSRDAYYFVYPESRHAAAHLQVFRSWLLQEAHLFAQRVNLPVDSGKRLKCNAAQD